jgi:outer membrane autotransporter protein
MPVGRRKEVYISLLQQFSAEPLKRPSGVGIQAAAGVTARLTDSIYLYGEYGYANSDKIRIPWAADAGLRWEW